MAAATTRSPDTRGSDADSGVITQVELRLGNAYQVTWVRSKGRPKVGQKVKLDDKVWEIGVVYNTEEEKNVGQSHRSGCFRDVTDI